MIFQVDFQAEPVFGIQTVCHWFEEKTKDKRPLQKIISLQRR